MEKCLICKFSHYEVRGVVNFIDWYGESLLGYITPTTIKNKTLDEIFSAINDGGFGSQTIKYAKVYLVAVYQHQAEKLLKTVYLNICDHNTIVPKKIKNWLDTVENID